MSPDQEHRLEEVFSAARDLPPLERSAFLERACGGDAELRRQTDSLLAAHEQRFPISEMSGASPGMLARNGRWDGMEVACKPGMNLQPVLIGCFRKRVVIPPGVKSLSDTSARHAWRRRFVSGSGTPNE